MYYAYHDLGHQPKGAGVSVRLNGSAANVMLVDDVNFACYRRGEHFIFSGGFTRRSPVQLSIPHDGHWFVLLDLGGYRGRARGTVTVHPPAKSTATKSAA